MSLDVPNEEFEGTFLPVWCLQTTRKEAPFYAKNRGKNGGFLTVFAPYPSSYATLKPITPYV